MEEFLENSVLSPFSEHRRVNQGMFRLKTHSLRCEVLFGPIGQLSHAKNTVCKKRLNIGHCMHRTAKVSPVVNQGIGDTALTKNERQNS